MQAIDIDGNYHDVSPADVQWRPSAYGVVVKDGAILLSPQHGRGYDLPGGGVDIDESIEDAVVREVKEETGIDVRVVKLLAVRDNVFKVTFSEPQDTFHSVMVYYLCEVTGGELSTEGFDNEEKAYAKLAEWVPLDQLDTISPAASYDWREIVRQVI